MRHAEYRDASVRAFLPGLHLRAGGTVPVSEKVTLRAGLDYDRRRTSYTRKGASIGVQFRF